MQTELKKTALNEVHRKLGARMVDFGGWEMPIQYTGPIDEHLAVRNAAGIFDVSHMGEIEVKGPQALDLVQHTTPMTPLDWSTDRPSIPRSPRPRVLS